MLKYAAYIEIITVIKQQNCVYKLDIWGIMCVDSMGTKRKSCLELKEHHGSDNEREGVDQPD
jgi:hypothetical protein